MEIDGQKYLTLPEIAQFLAEKQGIGKGTMYNYVRAWVNDGKLTAYHRGDGKGRKYIKKSDAERFAKEQQTMQPVTPSK